MTALPRRRQIEAELAEVAFPVLIKQTSVPTAGNAEPIVVVHVDRAAWTGAVSVGVGAPTQSTRARPEYIPSLADRTQARSVILSAVTDLEHTLPIRI